MSVTYYPINEDSAQRAKELNSFSDYVPGSATAEYRQYVDKAAAIAEEQKKRVDQRYHQKIDNLLDAYAKALAENMNESYAIEARVPSVMIAGPANFPTQKKEKQNYARARNLARWNVVQGYLDKIRGTGTGGISADDSDAIPKLEQKLALRLRLQEHMKTVNAYYRKHKTLDDCPELSPENTRTLGEEAIWRIEDVPYAPFQLSNNNAEIHRLRQRIQTLTRQQEDGYFTGWEFEGGEVEVNRDENRLQVLFDSKPDESIRSELKRNGFRWSPKAGAWQRQLNDNAIRAADYVEAIWPVSGEKPSELQRRERHAS